MMINHCDNEIKLLIYCNALQLYNEYDIILLMSFICARGTLYVYVIASVVKARVVGWHFT